jgi:hypothetical protein
MSEYRFKVASFSLQLPYQMAAAGALMSEDSSIDFVAPCFATLSIASSIYSVVVTNCGKNRRKTGSSGPIAV